MKSEGMSFEMHYSSCSKNSNIAFIEKYSNSSNCGIIFLAIFTQNFFLQSMLCYLSRLFSAFYATYNQSFQYKYPSKIPWQISLISALNTIADANNAKWFTDSFWSFLFYKNIKNMKMEEGLWTTKLMCYFAYRNN